VSVTLAVEPHDWLGAGSCLFVTRLSLS